MCEGGRERGGCVRGGEGERRMCKSGDKVGMEVRKGRGRRKR